MNDFELTSSATASHPSTARPSQRQITASVVRQSTNDTAIAV